MKAHSTGTWWNISKSACPACRKKKHTCSSGSTCSTTWKNGFSAALDCDAADWPRLCPGENRLTCPDQLTVEYYPTYQ